MAHLVILVTLDYNKYAFYVQKKPLQDKRF